MDKHRFLIKTTLLLGLFSFNNSAFAQTVPQGLHVKALSFSSVELNWIGVEDSFTIQRSADGSTFQTLVTLDENARSYTDTGLSASAPFLYKVCSIKNGKKSAYSSVVGVATKPLAKLTDITDDVNQVFSVQTENPTSVDEKSDKVIDNDISTKYLFYATSGWLQFFYPNGAVVKQYLITSANDAADRDPRDWTFEGSADGTIWTVLDTRKLQKFADRFSNLHFGIENTTSYKYYRLNIQKNNGNGTMIQLSEVQLFADAVITRNIAAPAAPSAIVFQAERSVNDLEQIMPSSNMIILNWGDASSNEDHFILERSTDQVNWDWSATLDKNTTTFRSVELKPLTTYYYRLKAVNDFGSSDYVTTSATTITDVPPQTIVEDWDVHRATLSLKYFDDEVAIYYDGDIDPTITWPFTAFTPIWRYLKTVYGNYSDPRLYIFFHAGKYSGGHPSTYTRADHHYRNVIDCGTMDGTATAWQNSSGGNLYLPIHEIGHIMEGASLNVHGSPERPIWGDSKYAEIFIYDVLMHTNMLARAEAMYADLLNNNDSSSPTTGIYWFRDWYYPIYSQYGGNKLLSDFFVQMAKNIPQYNGFYTRDMNWGEYIHFNSIAAGINLKDQAKKAFGWKDEWEFQFVKAQADFPFEYPDAPVNLMDNGKAVVNYENLVSSMNSAKLFDHDLKTFYQANRLATPEIPFTITVSGSLPTTLLDYSLSSSFTNPAKCDPTDWNLYGTQNGVDWELIETQTNQVFTSRMQTKSYTVSPAKPYYNYKLEITKLFDNTQTKLCLAELQFRGMQADLNVVSIKPVLNNQATDVYQLLDHLDNYPMNKVKIYGLDGRCVYDKTMNVSEWKALQAGNILPHGLYIISLKMSPLQPVVCGKVIVK